MLFLHQSYTLDLRSLAVLRIGIGLVILTDLCIRAVDLKAHYSYSGSWPSDIIRNLGWKHGYWTVHDLFTGDNWLIFLFTIHFLFAGFLTLGYFTRISTVLLLCLTISLHNRHIFIEQAGDDLLRMVLFWGIFLPWQQFYSLDNRRKKTISGGPFFAHFGYIILLASVYLFSAALKTSVEWRTEFDAVYYALSLEQLRLPAGFNRVIQKDFYLVKVNPHYKYYIDFF